MVGLMTLEIVTQRCTALVVVRDGVVEQAPPAMFYMQGWTYQQMIEHTKREGWKIEIKTAG